MIPPGASIGILGGGQLGRMMAIAARRLGYRVMGLDPQEQGPLGQVADRMWRAAYDDMDAARQLAENCALVTCEFETVPAQTLAAIEACVPVAPGPQVLATTRHRLREKTFLRQHGFPVTAFAGVQSLAECQEAVERLGVPVILKTCEFGYDGKGQLRVDDVQALPRAWEDLNSRDVIVEAVAPFSCEASVICQRCSDGRASTFPVFENQHHRHILDITRMPARLSPRLCEEARELTLAIAEALGVVGTLTAELFVVPGAGATQQLLVNELAPRPHNSGHISIDACHTCQFEQHIRAICGLPLGDTSALLGAGAMVNLLGDLWQQRSPNWPAIWNCDPRIKLHLYGKEQPAIGRKMGHLNLCGSDVEACVEALCRAREQLR